VGRPSWSGAGLATRGLAVGGGLGQKWIGRIWSGAGRAGCANWNDKTPETLAMTDKYNMSMRKFLKQVGVTSQQAIEEALRNADATGGKSYAARMVLTIDGLDVEHVVTGTIRGDEA
jgi:hypothetical protein